MKPCIILGACAGLAFVFVVRAQISGVPDKELDAFSIAEVFGVSHPRQIIDFDFRQPVDPKHAYMLGPDGTEVPFQRLSTGNIAVETDLPAHAQRSWKLFAGRAPKQFPNALRLKTLPDYYEITNGVTGVRVARPDVARDMTLAPIQGILLRNGVWTAVGPNRLNTEPGPTPRPLAAFKATAKLVEEGPLEVSIEVDYSYNRPDLQYGNKVLIPGGQGFYKSTVTIQADSPSVMIEDDTDMDLMYRLNVYPEIEPDQGRYRGHHATSVEFGREPGGIPYRPWNERPSMDAVRDFSYDLPVYSSYVTGNQGSYNLLQRMAQWSPWIANSGWYWMVYKKTAAGDRPLIGIFAGPTSRLLGAGNSGPGLSFLPRDANGNKVAAIEFQSNRRFPDAAVYRQVRVAWGIFSGSKAGDLGDPSTVQNIGREMNVHSGINLNKIHRYQLPDAYPTDGCRPLYMSTGAFRKLASRVRTDKAYYDYLYNAEPTARSLLEMWRSASLQKAAVAAEEITRLAQSILQAMVNGDGIYDLQDHYWMGGLQMDRAALTTSALLCDASLPDPQKRSLIDDLVLFASILWDNDFVPLFDGAGISLGTANMPVQQSEYRNLFALMLAGHPMMSERAKTVISNVSASLNAEINEYGSQRGSPHYANASMEPLLDMMQQIKANTPIDLFRSEPRVVKFADFYMNLLTPPEPRFGGLRKLISLGDGSTESSSLFGQMATGFANVNATLSRRLMDAWISSGKMESGFHGSTILKIDDSLPSEPMNLHNAVFPGWFTVLRNGSGTTAETALWFVNGDFYSDHRHQDQGSLALYALGTPISIDWGSMYYPQAAGAYMHSSVLPESALGSPWNADNPALNAGTSPWTTSTGATAFEDFEYSGHSSAHFISRTGTIWTRSVYSIHPDIRYPVILITDTFTGPEATANKVSTLNMMAQNFVGTPLGPVIPPLRSWNQDGSRKELPSATPAVALAPGTNRFQFTGQWGVDWNLYTDSSRPQEFVLGDWSHDWHPTMEQDEFRKANGRPFKERQYILRVKGTGPFRTLLVPYRSGTESPELKSGKQFTLRTTVGEAWLIDEQYYAFKRDNQIALATFSDQPAAAYDIAISGGPTEVAIRNGKATITIHGTKGIRRVHVPGTWEIPPQFRTSQGNIEIDYAGGAPTRLDLTPSNN
jgi:hypothetical protein